MKNLFFITLLSIITLLGSSNIVHASSIFNAPLLGSEATEPLAIVMFIVIILLLFVIAALGRVLLIGSNIFREKNKNTIKSIILLGILLSVTNKPLFAQALVTNQPSALIGGLSQSSFYFLFGIILLEVIVIFVLLSIFNILMGAKKVKQVSKKSKVHWIERINAAPSAKGIADEDISMGHDFDGIEELDNPTPPWWRWGFVISVIISVVYIWVYEIAKTSPNQYQELAIETEKAEAAVKEFLAKSAANVDENTVVFLNDEANIGAGKAVFIQMCAACHAQDGGGNEVGPNLTDEYWLHGGSIKDIFKTVKYGVPEKGMKSWKDDFSPVQIAQLSSYVKSLKGSRPANPKDPQGTIYADEDVTIIESENSDTTNIVK